MTTYFGKNDRTCCFPACVVALCLLHLFTHPKRDHLGTLGYSHGPKVFPQNQFSHRLQSFFKLTELISWHYFFKRITVLVESYMNCASNVFVSYRLFILYPKSMPSNFTFEFLATVFATSSLTSVETSCFQISYEVWQAAI